MLGPLAARMGEGVIVSFSADKFRELIQLSEQTDTAHIIRHNIEEIRKHNHYQQEYMKKLYELLSKEYAPPLDEVIFLRATPNTQLFTMKGRKHNLIMVNVSTPVLFSITGVGTISYTLQPGWNQLDLPEDSQVALASGADQAILYRCTNTLMV